MKTHLHTFLILLLCLLVAACKQAPPEEEPVQEKPHFLLDFEDDPAPQESTFSVVDEALIRNFKPHYFSSRVDKFSDEVTLTSKKARHWKGPYLQIVMKDDKPVKLVLCFELKGLEHTNPSYYEFNTDGEIYQIKGPRYTTTNLPLFGNWQEWWEAPVLRYETVISRGGTKSDYESSFVDPESIAKIANATSVRFRRRFSSSRKQSEERVYKMSKKQLKAFRETYLYYIALGGTF